MVNLLRVPGTVLLLSSISFAQSQQAVVKVFSDFCQSQGACNKSAAGTGFFISATGDLLTCYHVVVNASRVKIFIRPGVEKDLVVKSIAPDRDLALLAVKDLDQSVEFLQVSEEAPGAFRSDLLETYAYSPSAPLQHLQIHATADSFVSSGEFRDRQSGGKLFAVNLHLIPLDMTIYNGWSGAPLLHKNKVVGVISGSLSEGGSIAWAIPAKYMADLRPVADLPSKTQVWPKLEVMTAAWRTLRKEADFGTALLFALEHYERAEEKAELRVRKLFSPEMKGIFQGFKAVADRLAASAGAKTRTDVNFAMSYGWAGVLLESKVSPEEFGELFHSLEADLKEGDRAEAELKKQARQYFRSLPKTPKNQKLLEDTMTRLRRVEKSLSDLEAVGNKAAAGAADADGKTYGSVSELLGGMLAVLNQIDVEKAVAEQRALQDVVENLLAAAPDLPGEVRRK